MLDPGTVNTLLQIAPWVGVFGIVVAIATYFAVLKHSPGNEKMVDIMRKVHAGAMVFLKREYTIIACFMVVVAIVLAAALHPMTGVAYLTGAICSMLAGWLGMKASTRSGARACQAAIDGGTSKALSVAFQGGTVMGLAVAALGVLGLGFFFLLVKNYDADTATKIINGFAMGASSIALFARVGGGIYTKSADVGADLVGKVEAGIPEDDPRNPGVIADNVGDCVGDTAGLGADLFESYIGSVVATIAIAAAAIGIPKILGLVTTVPDGDVTGKIIAAHVAAGAADRAGSGLLAASASPSMQILKQRRAADGAAHVHLGGGRAVPDRRGLRHAFHARWHERLLGHPGRPDRGCADRRRERVLHKRPAHP